MQKCLMVDIEFRILGGSARIGQLTDHLPIRGPVGLNVTARHVWCSQPAVLRYLTSILRRADEISTSRTDGITTSY